MKTYHIIYEKLIKEEATVQSTDKKTAEEHLKNMLGDIRIVDVLEITTRWTS